MHAHPCKCLLITQKMSEFASMVLHRTSPYHFIHSSNLLKKQVCAFQLLTTSATLSCLQLLSIDVSITQSYITLCTKSSQVLVENHDFFTIQLAAISSEFHQNLWLREVNWHAYHKFHDLFNHLTGHTSTTDAQNYIGTCRTDTQCT